NSPSRTWGRRPTPTGRRTPGTSSRRTRPGATARSTTFASRTKRATRWTPAAGWDGAEGKVEAIAQTVQAREVEFRGEAAWLANHHSLRLGEPAGSREF